MREINQHCRKSTPDLFQRSLRDTRKITDQPFLLCLDGGNDSIDNDAYALRWGIEVYFKETKQHLGFLNEQTSSFA